MAGKHRRGGRNKKPKGTNQSDDDASDKATKRTDAHCNAAEESTVDKNSPHEPTNESGTAPNFVSKPDTEKKEHEHKSEFSAALEKVEKKEQEHKSNFGAAPKVVGKTDARRSESGFLQIMLGRNESGLVVESAITSESMMRPLPPAPDFDGMTKPELVERCKKLYSENCELIKYILAAEQQTDMHETARLQLIEDVTSLRRQVKDLTRENQELKDKLASVQAEQASTRTKWTKETQDLTDKLQRVEKDHASEKKMLSGLVTRAAAEDKDCVYADVVRLWTSQVLLPAANEAWQSLRPTGLPAGERELDWTTVRSAMGEQEKKVPNDQELTTKNAPIRFHLYVLAEARSVPRRVLSLLWDINERRNNSSHVASKTPGEKKALKSRALSLLPTQVSDSLLQSDAPKSQQELKVFTGGLTQVINQIQEIRTR